VDDEIARDYLEGRPLPASLRKLRAALLSASGTPSRETLARVAREYSTDVAALLFLETVSARPATNSFRARYEQELECVRHLGVERARPEIPDDLLVLLVPGWFYLTHADQTNANFAIQRRLFEEWDIPHHLVPVEENGNIDVNAEIVAEAIRAVSNEHRILIVSASKSGAEVAVALGSKLAPEETDRVVAWLSAVGAVRGSPLADRMLAIDRAWYTRWRLSRSGFDLGGVQSMRASVARPAFDSLRIPPHVAVLSVIAVPLSGNISERASFGYRQLRELGPNDGLTLLADQMMHGAVPLLLPGTDHYFGTADQPVWSTAVFRALVAELPGGERPCG
jgi:hypothetical protein